MPRFLQKCDAVHARHALIYQQQRDAVITNLQRLQQIESRFRRIAADHAIFCPVLRPQIALNRPQNIWIVVNGQQNRLRHYL